MLQLFILDVYQKHKLPDVDLVLTTFGKFPPGFCSLVAACYSATVRGLSC